MSGTAVERLIALAGSQHVHVGAYQRKDGTTVEAYTRLGVSGAKVISAAADTLRRGDYISEGGRVKKVESAITLRDDTILQFQDGRGIRSTRRTKRSTKFAKIILGIMAVAIGLGVAGHIAQNYLADAPHNNFITQTANNDHGGGGGGGDGGPDPKPTPPEPDTAKGYAQMFDSVPTTEWGGGDVSYSTNLDDGRRAWVYGDTLSSDNGFVHSTMIIQDGGTLHVANHGAQILPNGGKTLENGEMRQKIYWPEVMHSTGHGKIEVTAAETSVGTKNVWDFHRTDTERSRVGVLKVDDHGDVKFLGWKGWVPRPNLTYDEGEDMRVDPHNSHHVFYAVQKHPDITLGNGKHLVTTAQNWDDALENHKNPDGSFRFKDWRPVFSASS